MKAAKALRAAGFAPLPRWWVRVADLPKIKAYADAVSEEVNAIRFEVNGGPGEKPDFKKQEETQAAIDRMWHVVNDRMLSDADKLDIVYGELHRRKSDG